MGQLLKTSITFRSSRFIEKCIEEKKSLGESTNTVDYVAKRLNWDETAKQRALKQYPPLSKCSVLKVKLRLGIFSPYYQWSIHQFLFVSLTQVKAHLDYILNETHFTVKDINSTLSVFRCNLGELQLRINELGKIGFTPTKLYQICLSKSQYLEMVAKFIATKNKTPDSVKTFMSIEKRIKK